MLMNLWHRINRIVFGYDNVVSHNERNDVPSMARKHIQLAVYEFPYEKGPAALVRYTSYFEEKAFKVEQISYKHDADSLKKFDNDVYSALEMGYDVSICTHMDLSDFPKLGELTNQV